MADIRQDSAPPQAAPSSGLAAAYLANRPRLLRFLTARTRDPHEAEELLQELWLKIGELPSGPVSDPLAYLHRSALNLANDRDRSRRRRAKREADWVDSTTMRNGAEAVDETPPADAVADGRRQAACLAEAIAHLPEGARRVFQRHKLEGQSHAQIAAELGISKSAVEKHMAVALRHLVRAFGTEGEDKQ